MRSRIPTDLILRGAYASSRTRISKDGAASSFETRRKSDAPQDEADVVQPEHDQ
jgi:hypothetical protein